MSRRWYCCRPAFGDSGPNTDFLGFLVVGAAVDSSIQPIFIENVEPSPKTIEFRFMPPHCLFARLLLSQIIGDEFVLQLVDHFGRNHIVQSACKLVFQDFFARVPFRTLSAVTGAVVVHIAPFLCASRQSSSASCPQCCCRSVGVLRSCSSIVAAARVPVNLGYRGHKEARHSPQVQVNGAPSQVAQVVVKGARCFVPYARNIRIGKGALFRRHWQNPAQLVGL